ncbi:putative lipid A biosynthesis acyltransferase [Brachyspira hampsonii 30446]|uniref:Putative lipid A biosynthesis acyltransferase n=2 Tax=Brachyspira hampsonii TaxID=1287055 RepID=A0A2U4FKH3_9SPIR|nr:lysophospholipid acyltransferase family protein [Brachyspira hampsonii]EKV57861.1 putative lipid A biosynthesis acyltransferase [Brachyspira hampsonii 30446]MBW5396010.1 lipid A biosynthesis acyltransferase [Brachyspira hampsonii]OEJ15116.1 lipid A biosynthesis acyltransferase [Brachyspira hampsonii]
MAYKSPKVVMLEYIPLRILMEIIAFTPYIIVILFAKVIGSLMYYFAPGVRKTALINLKQAFPNKSFHERKIIAKRSMKSMIMTFAEFIKSSRMSDEQILKRIKIEGQDKFDEAMNEKKRGIVAITGHIGNWEYIAFYFAIKGYNPGVIFRPLDNPKLDAYMRSWREKRGMKCISRWGDLREIFHVLNNNSPVAFLCDQNYLDGIFVDFFGYPAATAVGPVAIAMKTGSPMAILYSLPDRYGHHKIIVYDIMYIEQKETKEETIKHNVQRYTKKLEEIISKHPENWLWVHPRWNTRPNGEPEIFYKNNNYK